MKASTILVLVAMLAKMTEEVNCASPSIQFTYVPPVGSSENVQGQVTGVSPNTYGVALFLELYGGYWTKPFYNEPVITLAADGTFSVNVDTGGIDAYAECRRRHEPDANLAVENGTLTQKARFCGIPQRCRGCRDRGRRGGAM